jgi:Kelch motif
VRDLLSRSHLRLIDDGDAGRVKTPASRKFNMGVNPTAVLSAVALAILSVALASTGCGTSQAGVTTQRASRPTKRSSSSTRVIAKLEPYRLPAAVSGEAVSARGREILVLGGLDRLDVSTSQVVSITPGLRARSAGALSEAKHDLAAVQLAGRTLVFGGGSTSELDTTEAMSEHNAVERVGALPSARSDLSAVSVGGAAYVLGGYDGNEPIAEVLRTTDGSRFTSVCRLPVPFRYAATAVLGTKIFTFGGELASGADTDAIQEIDTRAHSAVVIGHLPKAVSHASAVVWSGKVYVLGGRSGGVALRQIVAFDPSTREVRRAGRLPIAIKNAAAIEIGSVGYLIGGIGGTDQTLDTVIDLRLAAR